MEQDYTLSLNSVYSQELIKLRCFTPVRVVKQPFLQSVDVTARTWQGTVSAGDLFHRRIEQSPFLRRGPNVPERDTSLGHSN